MRFPATLSLTTLALLGSAACSAATMARPDESAAGAPMDTTTTTSRDTVTSADTSGYRSMARDTTAMPSAPSTASDTTAHTVPGAAQQDSTTGMGGMDTTRTDSASTSR